LIAHTSSTCAVPEDIHTLSTEGFLTYTPHLLWKFDFDAKLSFKKKWVFETPSPLEFP